MLAPPPAGQNPVPTTPPAISERAPQDFVDRLHGHQDAYKAAEFLQKIKDATVQVVKMKKKQEDLSDELTAATDRLSYERSQPVDRRKERSRDKRGR